MTQNRDEIIKAAEELLIEADASEHSFAACGWYLVTDTENFHKAAKIIRSLIALVPGEGMMVVPEVQTFAMWEDIYNAKEEK